MLIFGWFRAHKHHVFDYNTKHLQHYKKQHRITKKLKVMPELNDSDGLSDCLYKIIDVEKHDLYDIINVDLSE